MLSISEAMEIVDARRRTVLGDPPETDEPVTLQYAQSVEQDKAILSGYDVDHDEMVEYIHTMSAFYGHVAMTHGLIPTLRCAIAEAFQIGLVKGADSAKS